MLQDDTDRIPPLAGVKCGYCERRPIHRWKEPAVVPKKEIAEKCLPKELAGARVKRVEITKTLPGGHAVELSVFLENSSRVVKLHANSEFRRLVTARMRSTLWDRVEDRGDSIAIYGRGFGNPEPPPLVVIPGAFGSELHDPASGREIWPGSAARLLVSSYRDIALAFDEDTLEPQPGSVVSRDVLRDGLLQDFYGALLRTLERAGGYRRCTPGAPPAPGRNYYVFAYDWRLDNSASACALHALIEQVRQQSEQPALLELHAHFPAQPVQRVAVEFVDVLAEHVDAAAGRLQLRADQPQQSGLAAAAGAHDADDLAARYGQVDGLENLVVVVGKREVAGFDDGIGGHGR